MSNFEKANVSSNDTFSLKRSVVQNGTLNF